MPGKLTEYRSRVLLRQTSTATSRRILSTARVRKISRQLTSPNDLSQRRHPLATAPSRIAATAHLWRRDAYIDRFDSRGRCRRKSQVFFGVSVEQNGTSVCVRYRATAALTTALHCPLAGIVSTYIFFRCISLTVAREVRQRAAWYSRHRYLFVLL